MKPTDELTYALLPLVLCKYVYMNFNKIEVLLERVADCRFLPNRLKIWVQILHLLRYNNIIKQMFIMVFNMDLNFSKRIGLVLAIQILWILGRFPVLVFKTESWYPEDILRVLPHDAKNFYTTFHDMKNSNTTDLMEPLTVADVFLGLINLLSNLLVELQAQLLYMIFVGSSVTIWIATNNFEAEVITKFIRVGTQSGASHEVKKRCEK